MQRLSERINAVGGDEMKLITATPYHVDDVKTRGRGSAGDDPGRETGDGRRSHGGFARGGLQISQVDFAPKVRIEVVDDSIVDNVWDKDSSGANKDWRRQVWVSPVTPTGNATTCYETSRTEGTTRPPTSAKRGR